MPKKSLVKPSMRREWLRRLEEDGEPLSKLAKSVDFDVRTVKKATEMAIEERESRETRLGVLSRVLEKHYADLLSFAEKLNSGIIHSSLPMGVKTDRMWAALHEHLPRSPLWKLIDKMESLNDAVQDIEKRAEQRLLDNVKKEGSFKIVPQTGMPGLYDKALLGAMDYHLQRNPLCKLLDFKTSLLSDTLVTVNYGTWPCAVVLTDQTDKAKEYISNLMTQVCQRPEYEELQKTLSERTKVTAAISEELATIILKRIVPGHCKYCPV